MQRKSLMPLMVGILIFLVYLYVSIGKDWGAGPLIIALCVAGSIAFILHAHHLKKFDNQYGHKDKVASDIQNSIVKYEDKYKQTFEKQVKQLGYGHDRCIFEITRYAKLHVTNKLKKFIEELPKKLEHKYGSVDVIRERIIYMYLAVPAKGIYLVPFSGIYGYGFEAYLQEGDAHGKVKEWKSIGRNLYMFSNDKSMRKFLQEAADN